MILRKLRYACCVAVAMLVLSGGIVCAAPELKLYPETCGMKYTNPLRIKVADREFNLRVGAFTYIKNGEDQISSLQCQRPDDPPVEATYVGFLSYELDKKFGKPITADQREGFALSLVLGAATKGYLPKDSFESVKRRLQIEKKNLTDLPKEGEFYVWITGTRKHIDPIYYIPTDKSFLTPSGNPVVFVCSKQEPRHSVDGQWCATTIAWKENIAFSFKDLSNIHVPLLQWKEFYYDFLKYMEAIETAPTTTLKQEFKQ